MENLATDVNHDAVDAGITVDDNGHLAVVPAVNATAVDVDASVAAITNGLLHGDDQVALVVKETPPQIVDDMAAAAVKRGEALMTPGIALTWQGGEGMLDRGDLLRALTIHSQPGKEEPFVFGLDPDLVARASTATPPTSTFRCRTPAGALSTARSSSPFRKARGASSIWRRASPA